MTTVADIASRLSGGVVYGPRDAALNGVSHDSRRIAPGDLFAVLAGERTDGARFVDDAIARGARALLTSRPLDVPVAQIVVPDPRAVLGVVASACYRDPTNQLVVAGITGTNGKTTTAYLVERGFQRNGTRIGVMGTVEYRVSDRRWAAEHTTPEAPVVQGIARQMLDAGATHLVMETSSHGLELGRVDGCSFDAVAFTNLTQDHLDFHKDMESYAAAKLKLFTSVIERSPECIVVVNADDPFSKTIQETTHHPTLTVSIDPKSGADVHPVRPPWLSISGVRARLTTPAGDIDLESPLLGAHNLSNLVLALGIGSSLGADSSAFAAAFSGFAAVPGRLERVSSEGQPAVLVDYAHTPDALARVLAALGPMTPGRLICVFGCGGDRDHTKRPLMGSAVARSADIALLTSDNPRTEDPASIIDMILPGVERELQPRLETKALARASRGYCVELDRAGAIEVAVSSAGPDDTVLIAGKGHEDYQIVGMERNHFDDRKNARSALTSWERRHG